MHTIVCDVRDGCVSNTHAGKRTKSKMYKLLLTKFYWCIMGGATGKVVVVVR